MRRQEVDYKKVCQAASKLKKKGIEPSVTDICEELGLVTVTPELSNLLEKWYHTQPEFQRKSNIPLTDNIRIETLNPNINAELEKSLSLVRATLECTADGIMMVNGKGQVVDWNQKFVEMWRIPTHLMEAGPENLSFEYILEQLIEPEKIIADVKFLYSHPEWQGELPELHFKDGRIFERYTQPQRVGEEIVGRVYSFRDVTARRLADDELRIRERAIEASTHGIAIIDLSKQDLPIIYINPSFERTTGFSEEDLLGQSISLIYPEIMDQANKQRINLGIREEREETVEVQLQRKTGEIFWCELGVAPVKNSFNAVKHYVFIINEITQRKEMEEQLLRQATHDSLTELPNRVLLMDRVEQAILQAKKNKSKVAFLFLDLDRFKMTNDTLGHGMGDKLLQSIANKLLIATNDFDTVARFGGDEFVILLPNLEQYHDAEVLAQELLILIQKPIKIDQHHLKITASIGISFYPRDGEDYETLMKNADLSMYHAKDSGRNTYRVFETEMNHRVINYAQIDNALRGALKNNEFYLLYQPLIDLKRKRVFGHEALLRWCNPMLGHVSPINFIPVAEENGLIIDIGQWVIEEACKQTVRWQKKGYKDLTIAVNISGRQLHQSKLPQFVHETLKKTGLKPEFLELELTESLLVENIDNGVELMHELKALGVKLAIDDFGTGYSSLSYLKQFPLNKLKIDKSFIQGMVNNKNDEAIVKAIINLSHSLNLEVLAEGVENEFEKNFVVAHGCDSAQGYYFSPPCKPDLVEEFLKKNIKIK
ncbi:putative bifunctional diguanylate cyclase/phosphodiesterase [Legionella impletisoli]|uniref:cyclic-guanylate-specific phosphodiesterase n=1 Tax=Legionella impletisoli TaxID=343510 RepID=A0A917NAA4_9GAMM|nr:EAL domain-containing protein [Legionella impletisoli]GGI81206.1 histidine kinase [Legionella impletisoli]